MSINVKLKLGDIIKIDSPGNSDLNEKQFIIEYIDKKMINLLSPDIEYILKIEDDILTDKSIEKIILLNRNDKEGFIKQNNLDVNLWIDLNFGGDLPETFTGKITNIENDMMEVTRYPQTDQIIYIDFAYSGIPKDLQIKKPFIEIRESPKKISDINLPQEEPDQEEEVDEYINEDEDVLIGDALTNLNDFVLGEELDDLIQYQKVSTKEKRFGLDIQEQDIIDSMISKLEDKNKTDKNINAIHKVVGSFKRLRKEYSNYDINGNVTSILKKGSKYKPLVKSLSELNKNFNFILPVIKTGRNVHDIDDGIDGRFDVYNSNISDIISEYQDIFDTFRNNDANLSESNYNRFVHSINKLIEPYYKLYDSDDTFCKEIEDNMECITSNYEDFISSSFNHNKLDDTKFSISRFNKKIDKKKLEEDTFKDDQKMLRSKLVDGDNICISSFLMLPKQIIQKSTNLKLINLLEKVKRHEAFFNNYVKVFNKNTNIKEHNITKIDGEIDYNFNDINYFRLDDTITRNHTLKRELFNEFLNVIIPNTNKLIQQFDVDLERNLSLNDIIKFLEPFLIYHECLTFKQYEYIMTLIERNRKLYVKRLKQMHNNFYEYRNKLKDGTNERYGYKEEKNKYKLNFNYKYAILDDNINYTESEIIIGSLYTDYSNTLVTSLIDIELLNEENANMLMDYFKKKYSKDSKKKEDKCDPTVVVAKRYRSITHLNNDNDVELYFDNEYDDTVYELNTVYEKEKLSLPGGEYKQFLRKKLADINGINEENVDYIVNTIVDGKKKVIDGQYGILEKFSDDEDGIDGLYYNYYKRDGNTWVYDSELTDKNKFKLLLKPECDIKSGCIEDDGIMINEKGLERNMRAEENCISKNDYLMNIKKKALKKMITEFEHTYNYSSEKMKQFIQDKNNKFSIELSDKIRINSKSGLTYNNFLYQLSLSSPEHIDIPTSPVQTLLDKILKQENIYKKNNDILLFCKNFTRDAVNDENKYWKYCSETGVQILPIFRYELAFEYIKDTSFFKENYKNALNRIRKDYGTLSEDGDKWVSKEGGWKIIDVEDFDGEQYNSSGYKETKDSIELDDFEQNEEDILLNDVSSILENKKDILEFKQLYSNVNSKTIYELIIIFIKELGVSLNQETINFIIKYVNKAFDIYFYNEELEPLQKNKVLLILTLSVILLGIQLKVKNVVSTKTVKTCKTSFTGFPTFQHDGIEGVQYIACVAYTLRTKKTSLFKLFNKVKEDNIKDAIINYTTNYLLVLPDIQSLIYEFKNIPKEEIDKDVSLEKWSRFLPPLNPYEIKTQTNVSSEFLNDIFSLMKTGSYEYLYNMNVLSGKTIKLSYELMWSIQKIITKKSLLLKTKRGDYFTENSCCDDDFIKTPIEYFNDEDMSILNVHDMILFNSEIIDVVNSIHKAKMLNIELLKKPVEFNMTNAKTISENNIYQAIMHYCKIGDNKNVKRYSLRNVCKDIDIKFNSQDVLIDKIDKMKNEGYNFNLNNLNELMQIINSENKVKTKLLEKEISNSQKLRNILEDSNIFDDDQLNHKFYHILDNYNAHLDTSAEEDNINLQTYIYDENERLRTKINEFLQNNITYSSKDISRFNKFVNDIITFNNISETDVLYEDDYYHKNTNYIIKLIDNLSQLYPSTIINNNDITKLKHPKSWNHMSKTHASRVKSFIEEIPKKLRIFFGNEKMNNFFTRLLPKIKKYSKLLKIIPIYDTIITKNKLMEPLLKQKTILYIFKYIYLKVIECYTDLCDEIAEELEQEDINAFKNDVGMFIFIIINKEIDNIKIVDVNYKYIMKKVKSQMEKEKQEITDELYEANKNKHIAEVERFKKKYKNDGRWALGAKKELTQYAKDAYDVQTTSIDDMNVYLDAEMNENNDISMIGEDYSDGVDAHGMSED
tara:strand:+ start:14873 stop:20563 length:5691 start_codon:yes stop_codon:yes gene_type:complete